MKNLDLWSKEIAEIAVRSMMYEVITSPKPGLVDGINPGSHIDMNKYTFVDSSIVLYPFFLTFAKMGSLEKDLKKLFKNLRSEGIKAEKAMFKATKNVNTQKGLIFILGLLTSSSTYIISNKGYWSEEDMVDTLKIMTEDLVKNELENLKFSEEITSGERLYMKYGVKGIRGEVEKGLPTVRNYGLKTLHRSLEEGLSFNDSLINTLMVLMYNTEDSNVFCRAGESGVKFMKDSAKEFIDLGGMKNREAKKYLIQMDQEFIRRNLSPGGSADLLATTIMFYLLNEKFN